MKKIFNKSLRSSPHRPTPSLQVSVHEDDQDWAAKEQNRDAEPSGAPCESNTQIAVSKESWQEGVSLQAKTPPLSSSMEALQTESRPASDPTRAPVRAMSISSTADSPRIDSSEGDRLQVPSARRRSSWFRTAAAGRRGSLKPGSVGDNDFGSADSRTIRNQLSEWFGTQLDSRHNSIVSFGDGRLDEFSSSSNRIVPDADTTSNQSAPDGKSVSKNTPVRQSIFARNVEKTEETQTFWDKLEKRTLIYPDSSYLRMWDLFIGILILYTALLIPYVLGFGVCCLALVELTGGWMIWDILVDCCFMINIGVIFRTVVVDENDTITDWRRIAKKYLRSWFILDIVASFPFSLVINNPRYSHPLRVPRLIRLTRLLRLAKVNIWASTSNTSRVLQMSLQFSVIAHWLGCAWYYVSRIQTPTSKYLRTLSWGFTNLAGLGGNLSPETDAECILTLIVVMISLFVFATIIGSMNSAIANLDRTQSRFRDRLQGVDEFMKYRRLPNVIRYKIRQYYERIWYLNQGLDERDILEDLPRDLKMEVATHVHRNLLQKVPLFRDSEEAFIRALCLKIKPEICPPGDFIFRQGERGAEMYFIGRGKVKILGADCKTVIAELGDGSYFGEIALLTNVMRTASAQAVEVCELFVLRKTDFDDLIKQYPNVTRKIQQVAQEREKTKGLTFSPASSSQPPKSDEPSEQPKEPRDAGATPLLAPTEDNNPAQAQAQSQSPSQVQTERQSIQIPGDAHSTQDTALGERSGEDAAHQTRSSPDKAPSTTQEGHPQAGNRVRVGLVQGSLFHPPGSPPRHLQGTTDPIRQRNQARKGRRSSSPSSSPSSSSPSPSPAPSPSPSALSQAAHLVLPTGSATDVKARTRSPTPHANESLHGPSLTVSSTPELEPVRSFPSLPALSRTSVQPSVFAGPGRTTIAQDSYPIGAQRVPPDETDDLVRRVNAPS